MEGDDPTRDMLAVHEYLKGIGGPPVVRPIPLDEEAEELRESLRAAWPKEAPLDNEWTTGKLVFSGDRGLVICELLRELAARLTPGLEVGPLQCGDALADLASELAYDLHRFRTDSEYGD